MIIKFKIVLALCVIISFLPIDSFASEETLLSCQYKVEDGHYAENRANYLVLRDGDRLYARYREGQSREFVITDDVIFQNYEGEPLQELVLSGVLNPVLELLKVNPDKIQLATFYGIEEFEDDQYKMGLWRLKGLLGTYLGTVAVSIQGEANRCLNQRRYFYLF